MIPKGDHSGKEKTMLRILNGMERPAPESTRKGGPARRKMGLFGENAWGSEPRSAFLLSFFLPGAGHAYAGRWGRGAVWSILYLGLVLAAWIFSYMVCAPFGGSGLGLALALLAFLFLSGRGASGLASRGQRARRVDSMETAPASLAIRRWLLGSYAFALLLASGLEFFAFF